MSFWDRVILWSLENPQQFQIVLGLVGGLVFGLLPFSLYWIWATKGSDIEEDDE